MLKIIKSLNSSVVLVEKDQKPMILIGKGIGYGKQPGMSVDERQVSQVFLPIDNRYVQKCLTLAEQIEVVYFELTEEIIRYAEELLQSPLNPSVYFTLTDHLQFIKERLDQNMTITNRLVWEVKTYYPKEFQVGCYALEKVKQTLGCDLPEQEAANVAFHIINAQSSDSCARDAERCAQLVGEIASLVRHKVGVALSQESIHYARFITHVKFFVERFFTDRMLDDGEDPMFEHLLRQYPQAMEGAFTIRQFIEQRFERTISDEEVVYLAVHIYRLLKQYDKEMAE